MFQSNISSSFEPESSSRKSSPMSPAPRQTRNLGRDHGYDVTLPKVASSRPTSRQSVNTDSQRLSHLSSSLPVVRTSTDHSHSLKRGTLGAESSEDKKEGKNVLADISWMCDSSIWRSR